MARILLRKGWRVQAVETPPKDPLLGSVEGCRGYARKELKAAFAYEDPGRSKRLSALPFANVKL